MGKKKPTLQGKTWRFAGEALFPADLSETEERILSDVFSQVQTFSMAKPSIGLSASVIRGRETVVRACLGYFRERFSDQYDSATIAQSLATAVAFPTKTGDLWPDCNSTLFAAALWTLDYINQQNLQSELLPLLPETPDPNAELPIPSVEDFRYPRGLAARVACVFLNRKTSSIKEFRKIMGLIRKDDAAQLRRAFRDAVIDYFGRFLEVCKRVAPSTPSTPDAFHPLTAPPVAKDLFSVASAPTVMKEPPPTPPARELSERAPDIAFLAKTPLLIGASPEKLQAELRYRRMKDLLAEFTVRDPYAICAASLLLERENDLLMELNALTTAVYVCAERHLPWSRNCAGLVLNPHSNTPMEFALRYPFRQSEETDKRLKRLDGQLLSAAQLFYMATGYLLPRDRGPSETLGAWFREQGLSEAESEGLSMAAMAFSTLEDFHADAESGVWDSDGAESKRGAKDVTAPDDAERIAELTRQLKSAKKSAHDMELLIRQLEEQSRDEARRAEQDRMELRGLRETLFRTRAVESYEFTSTEQKIQLPWQVRRRILIFGGHDTWSKSIRPLLPGARFFERESLPDLNAIKGADVVWIQANALSHKFYYRIIETARKENILVRYFSFASARKCAEQVVETELAEASDS